METSRVPTCINKHKLHSCFSIAELLGSGKTFKKSSRKSQSIQEEEEEEPGDTGLKEEGLETAAVVRDGTEMEGESKTTVREQKKTGMWDQDTFI